jgi:transposase
MEQSAEMLAMLLAKSMNLGPEWTVMDARFKKVDGGKDELHIYIVRTSGQSVPCPECGRKTGVYDTRERQWRHLDIWQFKTIIHCDVPRTDCPECGVRTMAVPWEGDSVHFTTLFEAQALAMAMVGMTVVGMAEILGEHDTRLWRLLNAAVAKARATADYSGVEFMGVDETSRKRGHNCLTCFVDTPARRVIFATEGKDAATVERFVGDLKGHGGCPARIRTVTADLSPAFASGIAHCLPAAKRIADRFHVMQLFSKAIDKVRACESRGSDGKRALLKRTRYLWLKNDENMSERQLQKKRNLARENLKTGRACAMKEAMQRTYECSTAIEAAESLDALISWMMHSNLPEMKGVAAALKVNRAEILNYFEFRYTNAILEGLNSIIQAAKRQARGFRNAQYFKTIIYLNLGNLHFPVLAARECATH